MKNKQMQPSNSRGKLTIASVRRIRKVSKGFRTQAQWDALAREYNMGAASVRKIANGTSYGWVD